MKRLLTCAIVSLLAIGSAHAETTLEQSALDMYQSLSAEQKKEVTLPFDSPERSKEVFPPGKRPGIQLKDLSDAQREKALGLIRGFVSDYGWEKAKAIAQQGEPGGLGRYYLTYFGEPGAKKDFAWRIAEHHLTLVDVEYGDGKIRSVGPILQGANPPNLWNDEEDKLIALFATLSPAEKEKAVRKGKGISAEAMKDYGIAVSDLTTDAQKKVQEVYDGRMKFFSSAIAERIDQLLKEQGGLKSLRVVYWNEATKRCADGGRWDFKLGSANFLCDYESSRGHIHMSVKASEAGAGAGGGAGAGAARK
jgi:hypothetical protein